MAKIGDMINGFYTQPFSGNSNTPSFRLPAIQVTFGPEHGPQSSPLVGMLDTGADLCRIDIALIGGLSKAGTMPSTMADGSKPLSDMYHGKLVAIPINFSMTGNFPVGDFRGSGKQFDLILGMDFIRFFEMEVNARQERVRLRFLGL